jgi:hypothetical protein
VAKFQLHSSFGLIGVAIIATGNTYIIVTYTTYMCDYRRGLDWWMDLFTTYTHDSELKAITAPPPIFTIHKSPQHPLSRSLAMASNSEAFSASLAQAFSSQSPVQN